MSRQPERRDDAVPTRDGAGAPADGRGHPGDGEPPPFDTETRVDHTDVDSERLERLMGGRSRRGGGRREARQGGKQGPARDGGGYGGEHRTDDAESV
jgi:hypothetical protein